jgi:hypothetical protein
MLSQSTGIDGVAEILPRVSQSIRKEEWSKDPDQYLQVQERKKIRVQLIIEKTHCNTTWAKHKTQSWIP